MKSNNEVLKGDKFNWLTSLRGLAAIMVVILHLWELIKSNYGYSENFIESILDFITIGVIDIGKVGVVVFFLISGFLVPYTLKRRTKKSFIINRILRLYPVYWLSIILMVIIFGVNSKYQLISNITMLQQFLGAENIISVYWTLPIELIFYFLCILLLYRKFLFNNKVIVNIVYVMLGLSLFFGAIRYITDKRLPIAVFLGIIVMFIGYIFRLSIDGEIGKGILYKVVIIFFIMLLPITILSYSSDMGFSETWYRYYITYSMGMILFYIFYKFNVGNKILIFLGNISYSIYLMHAIVMKAAFKYINFSNINSLIFAIIIFFMILLTSTIVYYLVEVPFINISKKIDFKNKKIKGNN
ncbi:acyltransferase family protein [Clostridium tertium]|uniref:Acyltransferase family protein n=1 Tax=Clostridium tertium TaxID=1559 RepID=A0A6N2ZL41_9CLOT